MMPSLNGQNVGMQRNSVWAIVGLAVVVLAVILAFLLLGREPAAEPEPEPSASASASASESVAASPSDSLNAEMLERRWTVLFIGLDHSAEREAMGLGVNSDALMLVSLSADQSQLAMVSLPRDTVDVPLPDGTVHTSKINDLYTTQGLETLRATMEGVFGVPIDAHVALDLDDMEALIAAVDGVDVNPPEAINDDLYQDIHLEPGPQELDAVTAMKYVRTRLDTDYSRMRRQQEVIAALVERLTDPERDVDLASLLDGFQSLETDLPLDELPTLLELAKRAREAEVHNLVIEPPLITFEGDRGDGRGYILEADFEAIRTEVQGLVGE